MAAMDIEHDREGRRFTTRIDGRLAYLYYDSDGRVLDAKATFVPPEARGRGIGEILARAAAGHARDHGLELRATCPYVAHLLEQGRLEC